MNVADACMSVRFGIVWFWGAIFLLVFEVSEWERLVVCV
jgi:hypothetical protein